MAGYSGGNLVTTWTVSLLLLIAVLVIIWFYQKNTKVKEINRQPPTKGDKEENDNEGVCVEMTELSEEIIKPSENDVDLDSLDMEAGEA